MNGVVALEKLILQKIVGFVRQCTEGIEGLLGGNAIDRNDALLLLTGLIHSSVCRIKAAKMAQT